MTRQPIWWPSLLAIAFGMGACGDDSGLGGGGDCARICNSSCIAEALPLGAGDDCERACLMSDSAVFNDCLSETVSVLECLESIDCGRSGSTDCLDESLDFANCLSP